MREWVRRLFAVGRRGRRDEEVDDELRFHLDELARDFARDGLDPAAARLAAERELGGLGRTKQAWRDQRSFLALEETLQDARYGARVLRRSRGLSLLAAVMLAVAVGATTSLFTVVDAVLLAPLPYARAGDLAVVSEEYLPLHAPNVSVAAGNFLEWQDRARSLSALTAVDERLQNLTSDGEPQQVNVGAVSSGFERTVQVEPAEGRLFAADEFQPGRENVAIISHAIWSSRYGGGSVIGRAIVLDDRPYTVIGVMPRGFMFPTPQQQIWIPLPVTAADRENRTGHSLFAVARVRDGVSISAASHELHDVAETLRGEFPESNKDWSVNVVPAREAMVGKTTEVLKAMVGAVALLLLVACANVAGLLLTHGVARGRELAIRSALGASRVRIVRQLLTESILLGMAGASAGVALAFVAHPLIEALRPADLLTWKPIAIDGRALAFGAATAIVCGLVFGTLPALIASRANIAAAASERSGGRRAARVRQALVALEVALAVVLVAGAALLGQTLVHLTAVDPGFRPDSVVTMTVALPATRYGDDRRVDLFYRALFERLRTIPGVRAAGAVQALPLSGNTSVRPYEIVGGATGNARPVAHYRIVVPGYVEVMGIPLLAGRTFTERDTADRPLVAMVNDTLRRQAWGDRNPIGERITFGGTPGSADRWAEVIGIVGDVRHFGPGTPAPPEMYWPAEQIDRVPGDTLRRMRRGLTLVLAAASGDPLSLVPSARAAVRAVDPDQPIAQVRAMTSLMGASLWLPRAAAWLLTLFASAAAIFALLGAFGAASYAVAQRRRELAVRLALGADPERVVRLVLTGTLGAAVAGVAIGLALAIALGRSVASMLVGITPTDPRTLVAVSALVAIATAAACWLPARRAAGIEPMQALRVE
jgi:putative ABC transport system permease protein